MPETQQRKRTEVERTSDWYDATLVAEKPSRLSGAIFVAVCAVAVFAVVAFGAVDVWALGLLSIFVGVIGILWLADAKMTGAFSFSTSPLQLPLLGLIAIGLIQLLPLRGAVVSADLLSVPASGALSIAPYLTRFAVVQLAIYFVFFAAALAFINNQKRMRAAVVLIVSFGALWAFFGILQQLTNPGDIYGLRESSQAHPFASYVNRHHFAALMELTTGLTLALLFGKATKADKRVFLIIAVVIMGMAIIFTGSRGGLISFFAVLAFVVAANSLKKRTESSGEGGGEKLGTYRRKFALAIGALALVLGLFGAVIMLGGDESLNRVVGLTGNETDLSNGRSHFWQTAVKIISDNPILGTGLDSFGVAFTRYDTWNGNLRVEQAHNDYLQTLADAGIFGFLCVASFIVLLFKRGLHVAAKSSDIFRRNTATGALAGCFGILIHSLFDFPLRTPGNAYFFLIFAALATATINYPKLYKHRIDRTKRI